MLSARVRSLPKLGATRVLHHARCACHMHAHVLPLNALSPRDIGPFKPGQNSRRSNGVARPRRRPVGGGLARIAATRGTKLHCAQCCT